jgi:hypothetical protein
MKIYLWEDSGLSTMFSLEEVGSVSTAIEVTPEEWAEFQVLSKLYHDKVR